MLTTLLELKLAEVSESKKTSWRNYVYKMNSDTLSIWVWKRIHKIKGKDTSKTVHHLSVNDKEVMSQNLLSYFF